VDQRKIFNSDGILNLKQFPERLMIIGSGIVGCEFATIFSNFRQTEVHLLDRSHRVIPFEDDDVSDFVSRNLERNGVIIHHKASLRTIRPDEDNLQVVLDYEDGHTDVIEVDAVLISIGRVPNLDDLGLENVGLSTTQRGFLDINDFCVIDSNPNRSHIFAVGDVTGHAQLYSVAELQGRFAAKSIFRKLDFPILYDNMSTLMFFKPEVAAVGLNEKQLQARKVPYQTVYYSSELVNRTIAMRSTEGFVKVITGVDEDTKILGMRAAGPQASAFIVSIAHLINQGNSLRDVLKVSHPHPSVTEGIQECLRVFNRNSIFKPEAFPELIRVHHWTPEGGTQEGLYPKKQKK